ncbi:HET-domain-containing protein [Diaporthe eres]|nr:HET-domain-containing protein [Diaporthe eres]
MDTLFHKLGLPPYKLDQILPLLDEAFSLSSNPGDISAQYHNAAIELVESLEALTWLVEFCLFELFAEFAGRPDPAKIEGFEVYNKHPALPNCERSLQGCEFCLFLREHLLSLDKLRPGNIDRWRVRVWVEFCWDLTRSLVSVHVSLSGSHRRRQTLSFSIDTAHDNVADERGIFRSPATTSLDPTNLHFIKRQLVSTEKSAATNHYRPKRLLDIGLGTPSEPKLVNGEQAIVDLGGLRDDRAGKLAPLVRDLEYSKWNKRGWVFQERILSPRLLYFGARMIHFQHGLEEIQSQGPFITDLRYGLITVTSPSHFTDRRDTFPAIAGVARRVCEFNKHRYVAVRRHLRAEFKILQSRVLVDGVNPYGRIRSASISPSGSTIRMAPGLLASMHSDHFDLQLCELFPDLFAFIERDWTPIVSSRATGVKRQKRAHFQLLLLASCCSEPEAEPLHRSRARVLSGKDVTPEEKEKMIVEAMKSQYRRSFYEDSPPWL